MPAGCYTEGEVGFPVTGSAFNDEILLLLYVIAGCEPDDLCLVEFPVRVILDIFDTCLAIAEIRFPDQAFKLVVLAAGPLHVDEEIEAFFKR